jgi:hypothetical protein
MTRISGMMKLGEADAARREIARRQARSYPGDYALLVALVVICGAIGAIALRGPGMAIGVAIAFLGYWFIVTRLMVARNRKRMIALGMPQEIPLDFEATAEGFSYRAADIQYIAKWSAVTQLAATQDYWVLLVHLSPIFVPRRLFADANAERAFVEETLGSMSEDARRQSTAARVFAGSS